MTMLAFAGDGKRPVTYVTVDGDPVTIPNTPTIPTGAANVSTFSGLAEFPASELAAISFDIPGGHYGPLSQIYDGSFNLNASRTAIQTRLSSGSGVGQDIGISTNYIDRVYLTSFYYFLTTGASPAALGKRELKEFNLSLQQLRSWLIPDHAYDFYPSGYGVIAENPLSSFCVSPDSTKLYYFDFGDGPSSGATIIPFSYAIYSHNLSTDSDSGIFYNFGLSSVASFSVGRQSLIVLRDGSLIIGVSRDPAGPTAATGFIYHISSSGILLSTLSLDNRRANRITPGLTDESYWVASRLISGDQTSIRIQEIKVSDNTILHQFDRIDTNSSLWDSAFCVSRRSVAPPSPPALPLIPKTPTTIVTSPPRSAGCNLGGVGWSPLYTGPSGVVPIGADPEDGELLTGKRIVRIWAEVNHDDTYA